MHITSGAHVFLFNADSPVFQGVYGWTCNKEFIKALVAVDQGNTTSTRLYIGDLLLHSFCSEPTKVENVLISGKSPSLVSTFTVNKELFTSLIWDITDSISSNWQTVDLENFPFIISRNNIYCVCVPALPINLRKSLDEKLKKSPGYVGAIEIDLENPLHKELFIGSLINDYAISEGVVYYKKDCFDEDEYYPQWAENPKIKGIEPLEQKDFDKLFPVVFTDNISPRGKITSEIINQKSQTHYSQKIANELYRNSGTVTSFARPFKYFVKKNHLFNEVIILEEKLVKYVLNIEHPTGKHKAILFKKLLSIEAKDWMYLAQQISNGVKKGEIRKIRSTEFGIQYHVDIPITGLNRCSKTVRTAWIIKSNELPRLTSAFIPSEEEQLDELGEEPILVDENLIGNDRWKKLFEIAHKAGVEASQQVIPTPMFISGHNLPVLEGECGGAFIIISDARTGFARWLKKQDFGYSHPKGGYVISAKVESQSRERAEAYAKAFAKVIRMNGVDCRTETYLD